MTDDTDTNANDPSNGRKFGPGHGYPPFRLKLDDLLRDEHRPEYESMILRGATLNDLRAWLRARAYDVGRSTVVRHRQEFMRESREIERSSRTALRFARLARGSGAKFSDAAIGGLQQTLVEFFTRQQQNCTVNAKDLDLLAKAVDHFIGTNKKVVDVRKELASAANREPGVDGKVVVNRVREMLGMSALPVAPDETG
jgi:hypothetical protein